VSDLNKHVYKVSELVIGNSLEAVSYSYLNQKHLILNSIRKPYFFEFFEKDCCLKNYSLETSQYELKTPNGVKFCGASKLEVWERLVFYLSMAGLIPVADKVYSMRIEDNNLLKITTQNSRVVRIEFEKLRIFDTENISGLESVDEINKFKAIDWINVRSGMKHEYDCIETEDEFVKEVYFYPSHRMGSGENDDRKDLVAISYLTKDQIEDFNYSDTYVKFKILNLMKEAGIKGPRNGRRHDDPSKYAYHSVKIEPFRREMRNNEKILYENKQSCIFDKRTEREIYSQYNKPMGYIEKVNKTL
jgi:hypothetical protein